MARYTTMGFLGVLVALMPFLGFPASWERFILIILGAMIVLFALAAWLEKKIPEAQNMEVSHEHEAENESH